MTCRIGLKLIINFRIEPHYLGGSYHYVYVYVWIADVQLKRRNNVKYSNALHSENDLLFLK